MVQAHLRGNRNYTKEIHKALTPELIHRLFLDQNVTGSERDVEHRKADLRTVV